MTGAMQRSIWIGFDPREASAFAVARSSIARHLTQKIPVRGVVLDRLIESGLYTRPTELRRSAMDRPVLYDLISEHPMSTQHANARFLVPYLAKNGLAMFVDGDVLVRGNVARLFDQLEPGKALYCVKHEYAPPEGLKMDGQRQSQYERKNWSSVMIFNCDHPANQALTLDVVNTSRGRDLHRFFWLNDDEIGALPEEWNWLVRHSNPDIEPKLVHFTEGCPDMVGYESDPFADEWRQELTRWAA